MTDTDPAMREFPVIFVITLFFAAGIAGCDASSRKTASQKKDEHVRMLAPVKVVGKKTGKVEPTPVLGKPEQRNLPNLPKNKSKNQVRNISSD